MNESTEALIDEVMDALGEMVEMTCPTMRVLWLEHSRAVREELCTEPEALPDYPEYLLGAPNKSKRSRYRALSGWRHVVVWLSLVDRSTPMGRIYFQPFPEDRPPFSYSRRTSSAPGVTPDANVSRLRSQAAQQIKGTLERLRPASTEPGTLTGRQRRMFMDLGRERGLRDILKLEDCSLELFAEAKHGRRTAT